VKISRFYFVEFYHTNKMATYFNLPFTVSMTPEGFFVMSDGAIVDILGNVVGEVVYVVSQPEQLMLPPPQSQPESTTIPLLEPLTATTYDEPSSIDEPPFVIGFGVELPQHEIVDFHLELSNEHPGVSMVDALLV
jgi:hypothetical protein